MKQRFLLSMFVLSLTLLANAHTVTFNVKFGTFMTEKVKLKIWLEDVGEGAYRQYTCQYNENIFTVNDVPSGKYTVHVDYPDMLKYGSNEEYEITTDKTIPLDFTGYRKVTLKASEGFDMFNAYCFIGEGSELQSFKEPTVYLPDGTYQWQAAVRRLSDEMIYGGGKQSFTINGTDREVVYTIHNKDYRLVTFNVRGIDKRPVAISSIEFFETENSLVKYRLVSGKFSCMLIPGKYSYSVPNSKADPQTGVYLGCKEFFEVSEADIEVKIPYDKYKKLSMEILANENIRAIDFYMDNTTGYKGLPFLFSLNKKENSYCGDIYCMPGLYDYKYRLYSSGYFLPEAGRVNITEDSILKIEDKYDFYPVIFKIVDEKGAVLQNSDWQLYVIDESGNKSMELYLSNKINMRPGKYVGEFYGGQLKEGESLFLDFKVSGVKDTVTVVYDQTLYHKVEISSITTLGDKIKPYLFAGSSIEFYADGYRCGHVDITEDGTASVTLPEGAYTYYVNSKYGMQPLSGTMEVTGKNDQLELNFSQYGIVYAKVEGCGEKDKIRFTMSQENKKLATGWSNGANAILLLPEGTFDVLAVGEYKGRQCKKTITVSAGEAVYENFSIASDSWDKYLIDFSIYGTWEDTPLNKYTITLDGYGECEVLGGGHGHFSDVSAAESLNYTITSRGYIPFSGTINVNKDNSNYGVINISISMKREMAPSSVQQMAAGAKMAVYPTAPKEYVYIHPGSGDAKSWNLQLISATGAVIYNYHMQIDGETPLYVGSLPKGFYLLMLNNGEQKWTCKIFKK